MHRCSTCGSKIPRQARFCQVCGVARVKGFLVESTIHIPPAAPKGKARWSRLVVGVSVVALSGTMVAAAASALTRG
ncbi:MAG: hypothetical protein ACRDZ3_11460 [Acidimicrobiia bacterium]